MPFHLDAIAIDEKCLGDRETALPSAPSVEKCMQITFERDRSMRVRHADGHARMAQFDSCEALTLTVEDIEACSTRIADGPGRGPTCDPERDARSLRERRSKGLLNPDDAPEDGTPGSRIRW